MTLPHPATMLDDFARIHGMQWVMIKPYSHQTESDRFRLGSLESL